ncbi:GNAT family N-acetyltransferase [Pseudoalteromonas obscura]|uniref:GNAT family N-acetyltransferase n=1 Tax=Pseudoalteromonas obscura TaxID=3048491 RepID=A0ABT7EHC0_9GAMM|nr:GNAT family N-acetyltransferase [Pseudoalteromonas sp. P94(2023)]MDK2594448.1 GNAT family N-acetyltransferase [Pseudoalteromonas sp. P94(2023)]
MTNFKDKSFYELSHDELFDVFKLRVDVFVVEQNCPYHEIDEVDRVPSTRHILLIGSDRLQAYARCYSKENGAAAIGRVLISAEQRGSGIAYKLMENALACCNAHFPNRPIEISAQTYLQPFYEKLGFKAVSEAYLEDGIEHIDMLLRL